MNEEHYKKVRAKTRTVSKGTPVAIELGGRVYNGIVRSATNYFDYETLKDDWFIEFEHLNPGMEGKLGYYKQGEDGGTVDFPSVDDINPPHSERA